MTEAEKVKKVNDLVRSIHTCMFTTKSSDGSLRSRPMALQEAQFDGHLWFFTSRTSRKADDVEFNSNVNVSFCDLKANNFVSLTGEASLVEDKAKIHELWNSLLKTWFPGGEDDPNLILMNVQCEEAEYWDSPSGIGLVLAMAKSLVTGDKSSLGENEHVAVRAATEV